MPGRLLFILIILAVLTTSARVRSWNDASRMATIQSLVEKHSFIIDESVFVDTGDKVSVGGHFYSDKLALTAVLGALVYLPLYHLGVKLGYGTNLAYYLITLLTVKVFWIFGVMAFYWALRLTDINGRDRVWLSLALGFASLYFTWSAVFNNHLIAASCLILGFYFLLKAKESNSPKRNLFCSASFLAIAGSVDIPTAVFGVGFILYVFIIPSLRKYVLLYCLPFLLAGFFTMAVNYHISGSLIPVTLNKSLFEYPGSPWIGSDEALSGMTVNNGWFLAYYSFTALIGPKGFLLYNPLLFIALPFLVREIINRRAFRWEAAVVGGASFVLMLYYFLFTSNYGGWSYSVRWFVPVLPLLLFFMHPFFEHPNLKRRRIFVFLFGVSVVISTTGLVNPWSNASLSNTPLVANIKELLRFL